METFGGGPSGLCGPAVLGAAVLGALCGALLGWAAGAVARIVVGRLRRGADVPRPWCEVTVALLWGASGAACATGLLPIPVLPAQLGVGWLVAAAGSVDVRHRRLPDALTLPALPAALLLVLPLGPAAAVRGLVGAAAAVAVHALVHLADRRGIGAGDVKLAAPLGAVLAAVAWPALVAAAVLAALLTAGVGLAAGHRTGSADRAGATQCATRRAAPHGPSMLAATWLVLLVAAMDAAAAGVAGPSGPGPAG